MAQASKSAVESLPQIRRFVHPEGEDTWTSVAIKAFDLEAGTVDLEAKVAELQSWNLHVFMKPGGAGAKEILPCDIIFLEPPLQA